MTCRLDQLNVLDAAYGVAKRYPGGVEALAQRMQMSANVLYKKMRGSVETHHLNVDELSEIVDCAEQVRMADAKLPVRALCWRHGGVFVELPEVSGQAGDKFLLQVIHTAKEQSDVIRRIEAALANDGKVDARELRDIERDIQEAMTAQVELLEMVRARVVK